MDNIINNIYDEPDEIVKSLPSIDVVSNGQGSSGSQLLTQKVTKSPDVSGKPSLDFSVVSTEDDSDNDSEGIDTSWIQESERYHHISDNQERELMDSIGFYFIYINKHDYIEKILFEKVILETDPDNGFSFLSKETILKIIQNKKLLTPTSKYKLIDILSFVVDIEPNKVKEFLEMDTFDSDLEKIFLKVLPIFNDIHIDKSIFVFHSINHLYFIFQEVQHSSNHRTTLKSILKHNKSKEGSDNNLIIARSAEETVHSPIKEIEHDQRAESLLTTNLVGDLRSQPCSPTGAAEDKFGQGSSGSQLLTQKVTSSPNEEFGKPTNKGTKKVRIVDNIRELRKLSNNGRFTRKVF